jgi:hypothetical protein
MPLDLAVTFFTVRKKSNRHAIRAEPTPAQAQACNHMWFQILATTTAKDKRLGTNSPLG